MGYYQGKKVYITGGSSGIGKAIAAELVKRGASVAISARGQERLDQAKEELQALASAGQTVAAFAVDVSDHDQVQATAAQVLEALGGLDVLINNAGVAHVGRIEDEGPDAYRRMMDINYFGTVWTTMAFLPHFMDQRSGHVSCVSSALGLMGLFGYTAYAASKHAIVGYADCLRQDMLQYGVGVSVLFPFDTDTPQLHEENRSKPAETKALAGTVKVVSPESVAVAYLNAIARGSYHIIPGLENKAVIWAQHKVPWLVRWVIDRDLRKHWRSKA